MMFKRCFKILFYKFKLRGKNIKIGKKSSLLGLHTIFEKNIRIGQNTKFGGTIGRCSYIGNNCDIIAEIGRYSSIASNVRTIIGKHPTRDWVSTSPVFFSNLGQCGISYTKDNKFFENSDITKIGSDVWIGDGVSIIEGVKIGDGAIIAAGAVVVKDVSPYSVVGGVPAKEIRKRFSEDEIKKLIQLKWWNRDEEWIKANSSSFSNVKYFLEMFEQVNVNIGG